MSSGIEQLSAQEVYRLIQSVQQREAGPREQGGRTSSPGLADTTVDQSDTVPGRDVDLASFASITYDPVPLRWLSRSNPDGSTSRLKIVSSRVVGWQANYGSVNAEDTIKKATAPDLFSGSFIGWGNYSG